MKALFSALAQVYARWRFVEEESAAAAKPGSARVTETPTDEMARLRASIARERGNLESFRRYNCAGLAGPCESSLRALESRLHALELRRAL